MASNQRRAAPLSLRKVLFICFTLVSIIPIIFLSLGVQRTALDLELKAVEEKHLIIARNVTGALERYLLDVKSVFRALSVNIDENGTNKELVDLLHGLNVKQVWKIDIKSGIKLLVADELISANNTLPKDTVAYFRTKLRNTVFGHDGMYISGVMKGASLESVVYIVKRLNKKSFLIGSIGTDYIREVQEKISFGERGHAAIVDQHGRVLAHPLKDWVKAQKDVSFLPPVKKMKAGLTGVTRFYTPAMEADMIAGFTVVKSVGWGVMIPQPISELEEEAKYAQLIALTVMFLGLVISASLSWWLSVYISRPLDRIVNFSDKVATGDVDSKLGLGRQFVPEELTKLTSSFNHMVARLKQQRDDLVTTALRLRHAQKIAHLGNWELDVSNNSMWWSDEVYRIFGITKSVSFNPTLEIFLEHMKPVDRDVFLERIKQGLRFGNSFSFDHEVTTKADKKLYAHQDIHFQKKNNTDELCVTGTIQDISDRKKHEEELAYQAHYDVLTGLPNRQLCLEKVEEEMQKEYEEYHVVPFLLVGLDHFKEVNETLGHLVGDDILKLAGERIKSSVRECDTVARLGSDEFAIILSKVFDKKDIKEVSEKIISNFQKPFIVNDYEMVVGSSIGISVYPKDGLDALSLLQKADTALHDVKAKGGRGTYCQYTSTMNEQVLKRLNLRSDLAVAMTNDELYMVYQPIVNSQTNEVVSAEALLRWEHPTRGMVPAEVFIPLAEKTGYIREIGLWTLEAACKEVRSWRDNGIDNLTMSLNLSIRQVQFGLDKDTIVGFLDKYQLQPEDLVLEITESMVMDDLDFSLRWMKELHEIGIKFSIDDFGTGYSSLSYLLHLPVSTVKIDGTFISNMLYGEKDATMIETIITLSKNLGFNVVAEGVETNEHRKKLLTYGCDMLQGHYFSKPLLPNDFRKYLRLSSESL